MIDTPNRTAPARAETPPQHNRQHIESPAHTPEVASMARTAAVLTGIAALLSACGGGGDEAAATTAAGISYPAAASDADAARFLQQAQFSSTPEEIASVRRGTYAQWLSGQFTAAPGQTGWDWLEARGYGANNTESYFFSTYPADFMVWNQLMAGPDAMRKRVALALSEFFVASLQSAEFTWRSHAFAGYWDILTRNAFGNFRRLLEDVTLSPAMGYYLNTKGNQKENTRTGRVPDENYAREVMQLFTIGLYELNLDGTEKRDGSGKRIETYTQSDVSNLARVFTGYDFDAPSGERITPAGQSYTVEGRAFARRPMKLDETRHSTLAATFLGTTVPADTPGASALRTALDTLFNHANVGPFFARQMIQRLVTSNPSPAYVARVAARFNDNGAGVRGDLSAVWAAILLDNEARGPQGLADARFGKLREPMVRLLQWARSFGVTSAAGSWKLFETSQADSQLGQSPLRSPSVFNFFRPGFVPPGTALAADQAPAPEFQLINETTVGGYLNYMQGVVRDGIYCPEPTVPQAAYTNYQTDVKASYVRELALVTDAPALVRHLGLVLCAGQLSDATQTLIVNALNATSVTASSSDRVKLDRVAAAVLMVMASAEYLVQK